MSVKRPDLWAKQGGRCFYCKQPMKEHDGVPFKYGYKPDPRLATLDHIIPRSALRSIGLEGEGREGNLVYSCYSCNQVKGAEMPVGEIIVGNYVLTDFGNWVWIGIKGTWAEVCDEG